MGALSFKERFVEPLIAGLQRRKGGKRQSIRNFRKRQLKVGERVVLYFAQRTKWCRKLGEVVIKSVQVIIINDTQISVFNYYEPDPVCWVLVKQHTAKADLNRFARADGFTDFEDMKVFWIAEHGKKGSPFPYSGNLYKW